MLRSSSILITKVFDFCLIVWVYGCFRDGFALLYLQEHSNNNFLIFDGPPPALID